MYAEAVWSAIRTRRSAVLVLAACFVHASASRGQTAPPQAPCILRGMPSSVAFEIALTTGPATAFEVHFAPTSVTIPASATERHVTRVDAALSFVSTFDTALETVGFSHAIDLAGGSVHATPLSRISELRFDRDGWYADVELGSGVRISHVAVRCDDLQLADAHSLPRNAVLAPVASRAAGWTLIPAGATLFPSADATDGVHVTLSNVGFAYGSARARGPRRELRLEMEDTSVVHGFIDTREERPWRPPAGADPYTWHSWPTTHCPTDPDPRRERSLAEIAVGTSVFLAPGQQPWATVRRPSGFVVESTGDANWLRVLAIPGFTQSETLSDVGEGLQCSRETFNGAFVPAAAVHRDATVRSN